MATPVPLSPIAEAPTSPTSPSTRSTERPLSWATSLGDLVVTLGAQVVFVSCPEFGSPMVVDASEECSVPALGIAERLSESFREDVAPLLMATDSSSSCSARRCKQLGTNFAASSGSDAGLNFWLSHWRGRASGVLQTSMTSKQPKIVTREDVLRSQSINVVPFGEDQSPAKVVIAVTVAGGHVSQNECRQVPEIIRGVSSDIWKQGHHWRTKMFFVWAHFQDIADVLESLAGRRSLIHDHDAPYVGKDHFTSSNLAFVSHGGNLLSTPSSGGLSGIPEQSTVGSSALRVSPEDILMAGPRTREASIREVLEAIGKDDSDALEITLAMDPSLANYVFAEQWGVPRLPILSYAANATRVPEVLDVLILAGADVHKEDGWGGVALEWAARTTKEAGNVRPLLMAGADPYRLMSAKTIEDCKSDGFTVDPTCGYSVAHFAESALAQRRAEKPSFHQSRRVKKWESVLLAFTELAAGQLTVAAEQDNDDKIVLEELKRRFHDNGSSLSDAHIEDLFRNVDRDGDGRLDLDDFVDWIT